MDTDPVHWLPGSFFRRPEWRWLRAEYLVATGRRPDRRIDDDWVDHARAALQGHGGSRPMVAAVRAAREVWAGARAVKGELEARLLTDDPFGVVAGKVGLPVAVVEAYEAAYFAVRSMRRATDWLLARAVGFSPWAGFTGPLPGAAWKLAALAGGPVLLDVVIAATAGRPLPNGFLTGSGPRRAFEEQRVRLLARLWVATLAATSDAGFARVVSARRRLRALEEHVTGFPRPVPRAVVRVERFLKALPAVRRKGVALGGAGVEPADDGSRDSRGALQGDAAGGEETAAASRLVRAVDADVAAARAAFAGHAAGPVTARSLPTRPGRAA